MVCISNSNVSVEPRERNKSNGLSTYGNRAMQLASVRDGTAPGG